MEAFLLSTGIVALAEMGDKTQLLSFLLAAKFRRPLPIIFGILAATLLNHAFAGAVGGWLTEFFGKDILRWILGLSFIAMAVWTLIPDKIDGVEAKHERFGVLVTTVIAFFLAEMGDKTQVATIALAAKYSTFYTVVAGTTFGMMIANVPAVMLGNRIIEMISMRLVHAVAAVIFAMLGMLTLFNVGSLF